MDRENNDKNNTLPLGKHIFLTIVIAFNNYLQEWHAEFIQTLQVMAKQFVKSLALLKLLFFSTEVPLLCTVT